MSEEMNKEAEVQEEAVDIPVTDGSEEEAADTAQTAEEETSEEPAQTEETEQSDQEAESQKEPETKTKTSFFGKKKKEKDKFEQQVEELTDRLKRSMAEFDNYRKRTAKERMELSPEITARNLTEFLPVMDNLDRALAAECKDPDYKKGVEMIHESFVTALQNLGVEVIESDGAQFNPSYHQAVQQVEDDSKEEGTIAATFQKGYKIGEKVLRFAMVAVVK